jgi:hypothetical protein
MDEPAMTFQFFWHSCEGEDSLFYLSNGERIGQFQIFGFRDSDSFSSLSSNLWLTTPTLVPGRSWHSWQAETSFLEQCIRASLYMQMYSVECSYLSSFSFTIHPMSAVPGYDTVAYSYVLSYTVCCFTSSSTVV